VGAARFLRGLRSLLDPARLTIIVNTADDETFFGLHVSPDIDTVTYTLADRVDPKQGWGVAHDSFTCLAALQRFYPETWFRLGDGDLATHIYRTDELRRGHSLTRVTAAIAARHGVRQRVLPMSDQPVRTHVEVAGRGSLPFQDYLVKGRGQGRVRRVRFAGIGAARPAPGVLTALRGADAVILPPSNPIVSIHPILGLRGVRQTLRRTCAQVAAVSPLVRRRSGYSSTCCAAWTREFGRRHASSIATSSTSSSSTVAMPISAPRRGTRHAHAGDRYHHAHADAVTSAGPSGPRRVAVGRAGRQAQRVLTQQRLHAWGGAAFGRLRACTDTAPTSGATADGGEVLFRPKPAQPGFTAAARGLSRAA
jgi:LPPG:FO 2-phospho-L-lactate transferase